jgi:ABC-type transport system substrate-binding protein
MAILLLSCGNHEHTSTKPIASDNQTIIGDSIKYIAINDAPQLLPNWSKENTLIYHVVAEPDDMHPTNGNSVLRTEISGYTQVYIVGTNFRTLTQSPIAVKSLPTVSSNGLAYTYELRNDITFDNQQPIAVEDIIFTLKANKCPLTNNPHLKTYLNNISNIISDKKNGNSFTIIMKKKHIQNVSFLADFPIMQRAFFDKKNILSKYTFTQFNDKYFIAENFQDLKEWATEFDSIKYSRDPKFIVGAGPYQFEKWNEGQSITLVRKKNHWTKNSNNFHETSYPEKIIFKINTDANSQLLEFKSQTLDASTSISTKKLLELQQDKNFNANYNSRYTDTYNYNYIAMNMKPDGVKHKKIFTDKKVRRAMAFLTPLNEINTIINKGKNNRITGPVSPLKAEYNTDLKLLPFDIEQAKIILSEAGWKDTDDDDILDKIIDGEKVKFEFNINCMNTQTEWKDVAKMMAEQYYKAGIKANINLMDYVLLFDAAQKHNFDMMIGAWSSSFAPEDFTQLWHTNSWTSQGSNYTGFGNALSDALIDSINYTLDDSIRIQMIKRLQKIIYDEQPYIFMFAALRRNVIHKRFGNQEMYFEKPGVWLSGLKLLSNQGVTIKPSVTY